MSTRGVLVVSTTCVAAKHKIERAYIEL